MQLSRWLSFGSVALLCCSMVACGDDETSSGNGGNGGSGASGGGGSGGSAGVCGDGVIDAGEVCDDGNTSVDDGCGATCQEEAGWDCMGAPSACTSICGDGVVVGSEACDDGNTTAADGCGATCDVEAGYACNGEPSLCAPICGDGTIIMPEDCDDGNTMADDGCSAACLTEAGFMCMGEPSTCDTTCGDGITAGAETCDDGNTAAGDGCDDMCATEAGYDCTGDPSTCTPICGDGLIIGAEECDDMNTAGMDGCDPTCIIEMGWVCIGEPSVCSQNCGNSVLDMGEQCDDGNMMNGDRCDSFCQLEYTVLDMEPNDTVANAQVVVGGDIAAGVITANDFDVYSLTLAADSFVALEVYTTLDADLANYNGNGALGVGDCPLFGGTDPDVHIFDATGDVTDTNTSLISDDLAAVDFCPYIGPNSDLTLLAAGTYYIRVDGFDPVDTVPQYALDVRVEAPLALGATCVPTFDVCDANALLSCDAATNTCLSSCGDGVVQGAEQCDDGNAVNGDRCDTNCQLEFTVLDTEANDDFATAQTVVDGDIAVGSISPAGNPDFYQIVLAADSFIILETYTTVDGNNGNYSALGTLGPVVDCTLDTRMYLFDATGDPMDLNTALLDDDDDGDGACSYIGPTQEGVFPAGTYYVRVGEFGDDGVIPNYALDVRIEAPLALGAACDTGFDLCDPAVTGLSCDAATNTCTVPPPPGPDPIDQANWEQFGAGTFDLANTTLTFSPIASTYGVIATPGAAAYPDTPGAGPVATAVLALGDDDNTQQAFAVNFPYFGTTYNDVFVSSNGYLTFGSGDSDAFESSVDHFDQPRISGFFDDLDPTDAASGNVTFDEYADHVTITYDGVVSFGTADAMQFQIQLFDTGVVTITYLAVATQDCIVGVSGGTALGNPPAQIDFSAQIPTAPAAGDLVVNEIMNDPNTLADTNCDGASNGTQDEFVEIVNVSGVPLDLTGLTLADGAMVRHVFGAITVPAGQAVVVYGGGASMCPGVLGELASTNSLGLNNGGDTVTLGTGDSGAVGAGVDGISYTRDPDITGNFILHSAAAGTSGNFSPGFLATGNSF